jgi:hypothetical protein
MPRRVGCGGGSEGLERLEDCRGFGRMRFRRSTPARRRKMFTGGELLVGLKVLAELAEGVRISLAAADGLLQECHRGEAFRNHLLLFDRG